MSKRVLQLLFFLFFWAIISASLITPQIDPSYKNKYERGFRSFHQGEYLKAAKELEIAIFGYSDPKLITRGLITISVCYYNLQEMTQCETFFRRSEDYIRENGIQGLDLEDSVVMVFSVIWSHLNPHEALFLGETAPEMIRPTPISETDLQNRIERLEKQIKLVPKDTIAFYDLYEAYLQIRDTKKAKKTLRNLLKNDPSETKAYYYLGQLEYRSRRYKESLENFNKFLENADGTNQKETFFKIAWGYIILSHNYRGDEDRALELASKVVETLTVETIKSFLLSDKDESVLLGIMAKVKKTK